MFFKQSNAVLIQALVNGLLKVSPHRTCDNGLNGKVTNSDCVDVPHLVIESRCLLLIVDRQNVEETD